MATFNIQLPNVRQLDWNDKATQRTLLDFFNELTEKLNYTLNNLDFGNLDANTYSNMENYIAQSRNIETTISEVEQSTQRDMIDRYRQLRDLITSTATEVRNDYKSLFNSDNEHASSIFTEIDLLKGEYGSLEQAYTSAINQTAQGISIKVGEVENMIVGYEDDDNEHVLGLAEIVNGYPSEEDPTEHVPGLVDNLNTFKETVEAYMTFNFDTSGLKIGKQGSRFDTVITNNELQFRDSGNVVAYINDNKLYITVAEIKEKLTIGNENRGYYDWQLEPSNNSLSLVRRSS